MFWELIELIEDNKKNFTPDFLVRLEEYQNWLEEKIQKDIGRKLIRLKYHTVSLEENIVIKNYEKEIWKSNKTLQEKINNRLEEALKENFQDREDRSGMLISTTGDYSDGILQIPELKDLLLGVKEQFIEVVYNFYGVKLKNLDITKSGSTKMYLGSKVGWHSHGEEVLVGIFYLNAPENSSKLITPKQEITVTNGKLLIHEGNLAHCVSEHLSEEPRTILVFEVVL